MSVFAYLLVRKIGREEDIQQLSAEESMIGQYANKNGFAISEWYRERGSQVHTPLSDRPEWQRLFKNLSQQPKQHTVIFASFSSFGTVPIEVLTMLRLCKEKNIKLHFVDLGGDILKDHEQVVMGLCEVFTKGANSKKLYFQEKSNSKNANQKKREGAYLGGTVPFGYKHENGQLIEEPYRKGIVDFIVQCHVDDGESIRKIQERLHKEKDRSISTFVIQRLLKTPELLELIAKRKESNFQKQIDSIL